MQYNRTSQNEQDFQIDAVERFKPNEEMKRVCKTLKKKKRRS